MKKDWLLLVASVAITLSVALGIIRWVAPELLGISKDLQLVQIDKKVPPFFENIFRTEDYNSQSYLINDPITRVRAVPFYPDNVAMGPNDLLGFRNHAIPNSAKVVVLGDSQTYGNNAVITQNWPSYMLSALKSKHATAYNMSVGGWAAPQYLNMFSKAMVFKPEVLIIAFYTGNDPMESFMQVYGSPYWGELIPDKTLTAKDAPQAVFPAPKEKQWPVAFKDGVKTVFTPTLRLTSNLDHPAAQAGYKIMANVAGMIAESVANLKVKVIFTIIPTKELVFAEKVSAEELQQVPQDYQTLVTREKANLEQLAKHIQTYPHVRYIDVLRPLQQHAMQTIMLYPGDENGHPLAAGYEVIGTVIAEAVKPYLSEYLHDLSISQREVVSLEITPGQFRFLLLKDNTVYYFSSLDLIKENGWPPGKVKTVTPEQIADFPISGIISEVNPALFGPLDNKKK